jgi:hypothetical protein
MQIRLFQSREFAIVMPEAGDQIENRKGFLEGLRLWGEQAIIPRGEFLLSRFYSGQAGFFRKRGSIRKV